MHRISAQGGARQRGREEAGAHDVYSDPVGTEVDRDLPGQPDQSRLRRTVRGLTREPDQPGDRADVHNSAPAALAAHLLDRLPAAEVDALQVDREDAVEVGLALVEDGGEAWPHTGVVHHHIEAAVAFDRERDGAGEVLLPRYVGP